MNICLGYEMIKAHIDDTLDTRSNKAWKKWTKGLHEQVKLHGFKDVKGYLHSIENDASNSYRRSTVHSDVVHSGLKNVSSIRAVISLQCISFVIHFPRSYVYKQRGINHLLSVLQLKYVSVQALK